MQKLFASLPDWFTSNFTLAEFMSVMKAVAIVGFGTLAALIISRFIGRLLHKTRIDDRIAETMLGREKAQSIDSAKVVRTVLFWILMLFVFVAFFQHLEFTIAAAPIRELLSQLFAFIPRVLGALVLLVVAWLIAYLVRRVATASLEQTKLDQTLAEETEAERRPASQVIGETLYYLVFLLFLPAILGALGLRGLLTPVQAMMNKVLAFLPNLLSAAVIFAVGWFVARVVQRIVTNLLSASGTDGLSERFGLNKALGSKPLSGLIGMVVHVLILIPISIAALNALQLDAVTAPASRMLERVLGALPNMFGAALVLGISYFVARMLGSLVENLLEGMGFDRILERLGLSKTRTVSTESGEAGDTEIDRVRTPSKIVGGLLVATVMIFAFVEAANMLGFATISTMGGDLLQLGGRVLLGLLIMGLGLFLSKLASQAIAESSVAQSGLLSIVARVAIVVLSFAMGLRQMGLANEIITLAFGLLLGAIAIAAAIAFGVGGKDAAARAIEEWRIKLRQRESLLPRHRE